MSASQSSPFLLDFDGSAEAAALGIVLGTVDSGRPDTCTDPARAIQVCLPGLDDAQLTSLQEMKRNLVNLPPLEGSIFPRPETLTMYGAMKSYMIANLCPHPEADYPLNLRALVSIIGDDKEFGKSASPAAVASVIINLGWNDVGSWIVGNPLDKWIVRAAFYEVHKPRDLMAPPNSHLLRRLVAATRELNLEPVCRRGVGRILPVIEAYTQLLEAGAKTVLKVAHEGTPELFFVRHHARLLHSATLADMTDGMSLPLSMDVASSLSAFPVVWPAAVVHDVFVDNSTADLSDDTKEFIAQVSVRYCWAIVAACKVCFPTFAPDSSTWRECRVLFPE